MKHGKRQGAPPPAARSTTQRLHGAVALHQAGRLAEAEAAYRAVLKDSPRQPDALHLLGVLSLQSGRAADAIDLIGRAITQAGGVPDYHDNLGSALAAAGRHAEAADSHRRALRLKPDSAAARFNLGNALHALDRPGQAAAVFQHALALRPDYAKAWYNLGNALRAGSRTREAVAAYTHAVGLVPGMAEAHNNLGDALSVLGRLDDAVAHHRAVTTLKPDDAMARYNLGTALQQRGSYEEAEIAYREALKRAPGHVGALNNLGSVLKRLGRPDQAEICHREALRHRPDFTEALYNLGNALQALGRFGDAATCFEEALAQKPDLATASYNLALLALIGGDLARGWHGYERRFEAREARPDRTLPIPRWTGEPLAGRRLLIWREQGVGDEILFLSCAGEVIANADGPVVIETDRRLVSLLARSFPSATVRPERCGLDGRQTGPVEADLHVPTGSLPRLRRPTHAAFPGHGAWLVPDPARVAAWRARVASLGAGLTVGISWRSQLITEERKAAYTRLDEWEPIFRMPGIRIVNLQYGPVEAEIVAAERRFGLSIHRWPGHDLKDDFEETAGLIANLDLVVTVGTATGELAGALGVPVWRFGGAHDWSMLGTRCRPWYPGMRIFTPGTGETLGDVLRRIARLLRTPVTQPAAVRPPTPARPVDPAAADAAFERGLAAHQAGRLDEAQAAYGAALDANPDHADALHLLGLTMHQSGRSADAVGLIRRSLAIDPDFPQAHNNLGLILQALGQETAAARHFACAMATHPAYAEALTHLGLIRQRQRRHDDARRWQRRAIRLRPTDPNVRTNLGSALEMAGRFVEAEAVYRRSAALHPAMPDTLNNLGTMARTDARLSEAGRWMARALRIDPGFALAAWNLGLLKLANGELREGWAGYQRRFEVRQLQRARDLPMPWWGGQPLRGRRLLVWNEQGVGDEILFASCLDDLAEADGPVTVECDRRLVPLFRRAFPWATIRAETGRVDDAELQVAAGSLAAMTRDRLDRFPARPAYLHPDPVLRAHWAERVAALGPGLKVGIGWRSQVVDAHRKAAYTRLEDWAPVLTAPGVRVVNLQYGDCAAEIAATGSALGVTIHRWPELDLKDDFDGTAALVANLDLVIVPATAAGELAGALGVPVWRLGGSDWTWLGSGARPWFPSMRVFAPRPGEALADVLDRIGRLLRAGAVQAVAAVSARF